MASPVWQNGTNGGTTSNAASSVVTLPSSIGANDVCIVTIYKENLAAVTPPAGFTEKTGTGVPPAVGTQQAQYTFWKRMAGGESGTVTFSWTGSTFQTWTCDRISGCVTSGDPIEAIAGANSNTSTTAEPAVSLASTSANSLLYHAACNFLGGDSQTTAPTGFTERQDTLDVLASNTKDNTAGGATGSLSGTWNSAATGQTAVVLNLLSTSATGPTVYPAQPGKSWRRRFRHRQQTAFAGAPTTAIAGVTAQVTVNAESAATVITYVQPTAQPAQPGRTWKRQFQRPRQRPVTPPPPQLKVAGATAQVTVNAETGNARVAASGSVAQVTVNAEQGAVTAYVQPRAQPVQPGLTWRRRFQRPRQLPFAGATPATTVTGATAQVTVNAETGAVTAYVQPTAPPLQPGLTWRRRFQRPRQLPVAVPTTAVSVQGATAQVTVNAETGAVTAYVQPTAQPAQPGQTWRRRFQRPRQRAFVVPTTAVAVQGATAQVTVNAETGAVTAYVQPTAQPIQPGRTWLRRYRHRVIPQAAAVISIRTPLHLGGTEADANQFGGTETTVDLLFGGVVNDSNLFGGTQADANLFGGTEADANLFGGTESDANLFGGTAADANLFGGTDLEWTMQPVNLTLAEFNDETLNVAVQSNSVAYDLTGKTLQALFKTAAGVSDTDPSTITLSSPSSGITITNAPGGLATIIIPRADLANANIKFWRMDVVVGGLVNTVFYGNVTVTLL